MMINQGFKALLRPASFTLGPDATYETKLLPDSLVISNFRAFFFFFFFFFFFLSTCTQVHVRVLPVGHVYGETKKFRGFVENLKFDDKNNRNHIDSV